MHHSIFDSLTNMLSIRTMALVLILRKLNKENGIKFNVGIVVVVVYNAGKRGIHENSGIPQHI
jgi:hypothetical protein